MIQLDKIKLGLVNRLLPVANNLGLKKSAQAIYGLIRTINFQFKPIKNGSAVFIGDSLIEQWINLETTFKKYKAVNRGISGDTSRQLKIRLQRIVNIQNTKVMVILIGTNDINSQVPIASVADNIQNLVDTVSKNNDRTKILICELLPRKETQFLDIIKQLNARLAKDFKYQKNATLVKTFDSFIDESNLTINSTLFSDGVHLNSQGYLHLEEILNFEINKIV